MKLYLIRHGDPDYETDSLTPQGRSEAQALVAYLRGEGIDRIVSSPLGRARETAQFTADALGLSPTVEPWMAELDLRTPGDGWRAAWDLPGHTIRNSDYLADTSHVEGIPEMPGSQIATTIGEMRSQSDGFLAALGYQRDAGVYRVTSANEHRIAIFAHGGFGLTWLSILLEIPAPLMWSGFFLHTSSVTQILFDQRDDGLATPRCIMMSALPHLFAAGLKPGQAGIKANYT